MVIIIHMKKLLDSDWLRAVQFKCNTSAKSVTPVQITHRNSGLWFAERHWESFRLMISCKRQWPKFCTETLKKIFSNAKKRASRNILWHFFHANFFMFVLLICNHTVFLVQCGINLHLWVFQKLLKNSLVQINSKLNSKPYDWRRRPNGLLT